MITFIKKQYIKHSIIAAIISLMIGIYLYLHFKVPLRLQLFDTHEAHTEKISLLSIKLIQKACKAFTNHQLHLFDPHVHDHLCESRASYIGDLYDNQEIHTAINFTLDQLSKEPKIYPNITPEQKFIVLSYFASNVNKALIKKMWNNDSQELDTLYEDARMYINKKSMDYFRYAINNIIDYDGTTYVTAPEETVKAAKLTKIAQGTEVYFAYIAAKAFLEQLRKKTRPIVLMARCFCDHGYHDYRIVYTVSERDKNYKISSIFPAPIASHDFIVQCQEKNPHASCWTVAGMSFAKQPDLFEGIQKNSTQHKACDCTYFQNILKRFENSDIKTILLCIFASLQPQFHLDKEKENFQIPWQKLELKNSTLHKEFESHCLDGKKLGTSIHNMSFFMASHIFVDTLQHALERTWTQNDNDA